MMSISTLVALVGNDISKAKKLVEIFVKLVRSCLVAIHKEDQAYDDVANEESSESPESNSDCLYPAIDSDPSPVQSGE